MKGFLQALGMVITILWLLGNLGVIDFRICINAPGDCGSPARAARLTT